MALLSLVLCALVPRLSPASEPGNQEGPNLMGLKVLSQGAAATFQKFDINGDGKVVKEEALQQGPSEYMRERGLDVNDEDAQDWIFDYSNKLTALFPQSDKDGDGLDQQEFVSWLKSMDEARGYNYVEQGLAREDQKDDERQGEDQQEDEGDHEDKGDEDQESQDSSLSGSVAFASMDQDNSGSVNKQEILQSAINEHSEFTSRAVDHPDVVSWKSDFEIRLNANFASCDADSDGQLNFVELNVLRAKLAV